ncbi:MAG: D-erythronate dehydrogenase [Alphaproteobacteria bacterium]
MRVVITGGAGFLGRRLAARLLDRGTLPDPKTGLDAAITEVVLFDAIEPEPIVGANGRVRAIVGDIADRASVRQAIGEAAAVFHLAAVVSAAAEADFDLGLRVNLDGVIAVLEACRACTVPPRFVFTSSIAVYGGALPQAIGDETSATPQSSYGTQKAIGELLVNDYSRKGFVDGRAIRLPTVVVRPGKPNMAASGFASSIIREPLAGTEAVCPVDRSTRVWILSPRGAVASLVHACVVPTEAWGTNRTVMLPGIEVSVGGMIDALQRIAGRSVARRIRWQPDAKIARIVESWPHRFGLERAVRMGFSADTDIDAIIKSHIEDELGGRFAA